MSTAVAIVVTAVALACPLHVLWRIRRGRGACCPPARGGTATALRERQRELGAHIESLAPSEVREGAPERH